MQEVFEKIIEKLKIERKSYEAEHAWNYAKGLEYAEEIVKQAATECNNGWIPVEDRVPERNKPVLVYAESRTISGGIITMVGVCDKGFWFIQNGVDTLGFPCRDYKVIAWHPLPEPYQTKGE